MLSLVNDCTNYQQVRFCEKLHSLRPISLEFRPKTVHWYWGDTGTGKTKAAVTESLELANGSEENIWVAGDSSKWFDGYHGQRIAIIDDIRAKNWSYDTLLRLLDGYSRRVEIKGGFTEFNPEVVFITASYPPDRTYAGTLEHHGSIEQLERRLTDIVEFVKET